MTARQQVPSWLGSRIRLERERRGWSQRELGRRSGVSGAGICKIENGGDLTVSSALSISAGLGIPLPDLVTEPGCLAYSGVRQPGFTCNVCGAGGAG